MANFNRVVLMGRLVRKPEFVDFRNGGRVAKFSLAVNNRKKSADGKWEDDPMYVDCELYNRGESKQADTVERLVHDRGLDKGWSVLIEGKLVQDRWEKDGKTQSKLKVVVDSFQLISEPRNEGRPNGVSMGGNGSSSKRASHPEVDDNEEEGYRQDLDDDNPPF